MQGFLLVCVKTAKPVVFLYLASCEVKSQKQRKHHSPDRNRHAGPGVSARGSYSLASCMKLERTREVSKLAYHSSAHPLT